MLWCSGAQAQQRRPFVKPGDSSSVRVQTTDTTKSKTLLRQAQELQKQAKELEQQGKAMLDSARKLGEEKLKLITDEAERLKQQAEDLSESALDVVNDAARKAEEFQQDLKRITQSIQLFQDNSRFSQTMRNLLAYFNTYYNAQRLMIAVEDEFFFQDEKKRLNPRTVIVEPHTLQEDVFAPEIRPAFLEAFVITPERLQPVLGQVDSVILKGSKILARHARSNVIDGTLFLLAKALFYKQDWFQAQMKCQELIDNFPYSQFSPDAHLLLAKAYMLQRKFPQGENALLKAIDIAWGQRRYDVLSEAFKLQADVNLYFNRLEEATKPYRRAIAQADDPVQQSRWQVDLGVLLYRMRQFRSAEFELSKVPKLAAADGLAIFESQLFRAASLAQMKQYGKSDTLLTALESNRSFAEWRSWLVAERLNFYRLQMLDNNEGASARLDSVCVVADTIPTNRAPLATAFYQLALTEFKRGDDKQAGLYFQKSDLPEAPSQHLTTRYKTLMKELERLPYARAAVEAFVYNDTAEVHTAQRKEDSLRSLNDTRVRDSLVLLMRKRDSLKAYTAMEFFLAARASERLGRPDSALLFYSNAAFICPANDTARARYLYSMARLTGFDARPVSYKRKRADSLLALVVQLYPQTQFASEARVRLGLVEQEVDSAAVLFASAENLRSTGNVDKAARRFYDIAVRYPRSTYAPRSLYLAGWLYEQQYKRDSAYKYFSHLVERYPVSPYALEVQPTVNEVFLFFKEQRRIRDSLAFADSLAAAVRADSIKAARELEEELKRNQQLPQSPDAAVTNTLPRHPQPKVSSSASPVRNDADEEGLRRKHTPAQAQQQNTQDSTTTRHNASAQPNNSTVPQEQTPSSSPSDSVKSNDNKKPSVHPKSSSKPSRK